MKNSILFRMPHCMVCLLLFLCWGSATSVGYAGVNVWTTGGPYGGRIRALAVDNAGSVYTGVFGRGLFKSSDGGMHWAPMNSGLADLFVNAVAVDDSGAIYVGTGEEQPASTPAGGARIFKSTNGGATWNAVFSLPSEHWCVKTLAVSGGKVYAGTLGHGVLFSDNGGLSWTSVSSGLTNLDVLALAAHGSTIYAGTKGDGVFRLALSPSGPTPWSSVSTGLGDLFINALTIDAAGTVYAGTNNGVFFSTSSGASWVQFGLWWPGLCVNSLAVEGSGLVYAGACLFGVAKSTPWMPFFPAILPWEPANEGLSNANVKALAIDNSGVLYAGTDGGGVYKSTDGGAIWNGVNAGIPHLDVWALATDNSGTVYAGAYGGGVSRSSNGGSSWEPINSGLFTLYIPSVVVDDQTASMYAADAPFGVYKSTNEGASWDQVNSGIPPSCPLIYKLVMDSFGVVYAVGLDCAKGAQLYRSSNGGATWTIPDPTPKAIPISLVEDGLGTLYAGTSGGFWKTGDGGASYVPLGPNLPDPTLMVSALANDPANPGTVYAGTWGGGILRSTDGGATWMDLGLSGQGVMSLLVRPDTGDLYAGTWGQGVLRSTNGGLNWGPFNKGIENTIVLTLVNDPVDPTKIYAGLSYGSVYQIQDVAAPTASFSLTAFSPGVSQEVTFQSTSTGMINQYFWDFGDGQQGSGPSARHAYSAVGTYSARLSVSGPGGVSTSAPVAVKVAKKPGKRVKVLLLGPSSGLVGTSLGYQAMVSSEVGSTAHYQFDWGDRNITGWLPASAASHIWGSPGRYRVKARVLDSLGKLSGWSRSITLNISGGSPAITGNHDAEPNVASPYTASMASAGNGPYRYSFSFDGGSTWSDFSLEPTSSHFWPDGGTYCVKAKALDKRGRPSPESHCFYVNVALPDLPEVPPSPH
jgi:PKD repeat protein